MPVTLRTGYSPSGNFIHVEQVTQGDLRRPDVPAVAAGRSLARPPGRGFGDPNSSLGREDATSFHRHFHTLIAFH